MAEDFETLARAYCGFVDQSASYKREDLVEQLEQQLAALYAAALLLSSGDPGDHDADGMTHDEWSALYRRLQSQLGDVNGYWSVWDPFVEEPPVRGELADVTSRTSTAT